MGLLGEEKSSIFNFQSSIKEKEKENGTS